MTKPSELPARLQGVGEKVRRARRHRGELGRKIERWGETQSYEFIHDHDAKTGQNTVRVKPPRLPLEWSVLLGDCLFDLRSALDHLVYALVIESGVMPPEKNRLQFPIVSFSKDYPAGGGHYLTGMRADWRDKIETLQPYNRSNRPTELEILATLNDFDKHRMLHSAALAVEQIPPEMAARVTALGPIKSLRLGIHNYVGLPIEQAGLHSLIVTPPTTKVHFEPQQVPPVQVAFGDADSLVPMPKLGDVLREIDRIVGIFRPIFEGGTI